LGFQVYELERTSYIFNGITGLRVFNGKILDLKQKSRKEKYHVLMKLSFS